MGKINYTTAQINTLLGNAGTALQTHQTLKTINGKSLVGSGNIVIGGGGGGGTTDYDDLENKPQIGGVTLSGNKTASDLGLANKMVVESSLPAAAGGVVTLASGKVYGSDTEPINIDGLTIDCSAVTDETLLYYSISSSATITYSSRIGDVPTDEGIYVLSALDGVIVIGKLESETTSEEA